MEKFAQPKSETREKYVSFAIFIFCVIIGALSLTALLFPTALFAH